MNAPAPRALAASRAWWYVAAAVAFLPAVWFLISSALPGCSTECERALPVLFWQVFVPSWLLAATFFTAGVQRTRGTISPLPCAVLLAGPAVYLTVTSFFDTFSTYDETSILFAYYKTISAAVTLIVGGTAAWWMRTTRPDTTLPGYPTHP